MRVPLSISLSLHNLAVVNYYEMLAHNEALEKEKTATEKIENPKPGFDIEREGKLREEQRLREIRKCNEQDLRRLRNTERLHPNKVVDRRLKKALEKKLEAKYSLDKALKKENEKMERDRKKYATDYPVVKDPLEESFLPAGRVLHPLNDFSRSPADYVQTLEVLQSLKKGTGIDPRGEAGQLSGVLPNLFLSLWMGEKHFEGMKKELNKQRRRRSVIKLAEFTQLEDFYSKDPTQVFLKAPHAAKTCLLLGELYLTHSSNMELAEYWLKYGKSLAERFKSREDSLRAQTLLSAYDMEQGEVGRAAKSLGELDKDELYLNTRLLGVHAMVKALHGIALRSTGEGDKALVTIEQARELRKRVGPMEERRLQMHTPLWTLYDPEIDSA